MRNAQHSPVGNRLRKAPAALWCLRRHLESQQTRSGTRSLTAMPRLTVGLALVLTLLAVMVFSGQTAAQNTSTSALVANAQNSPDQDLLLNNGAVVLIYHRFGEGDLPSTNTTLEQLEAHIEELTSGPYTVLSLKEILAAFKSGERLPDRTVAITIDDAYLSVYTEAWPRLRRAGLPFTVFVSSDPVDRQGARYMTWDHLRELNASDLVSVEAHSASHPHMADLSEEEARAELQRSNARLERELGQRPTLFSYPYGEFSLVTRSLAIEAGYEAAFAQHSGVLARNMDLFSLPRFSLNEQYGTQERFRLIVNAMPLPQDQVTPSDTALTKETNPPIYGFTVVEGAGPVSRLNCFLSANVGMSVERLERRIEVRMDAPLPAGRTRVNCTMPGPDGRWRWNGRQFYLLGSPDDHH
ncbi:polysaccharide deacetylase family protein [Rhodovibrionaceae bacterium A322]